MKRFIFLILIISCLNPLFGQKKKSVVLNKIKCITVLNEDYEDNKGKSVKESINCFDELGNNKEEIEFDKKGAEKKHILYEYNGQGKKVKETYIKPNGTKEKIIEYKYQDSLRTERIVYLPNGKVKSKKKYIYEYYK